MNYTVQFSPEAQDQLDELEAFITVAASPVTAANYVDAIDLLREPEDVSRARHAP